MSSSDERTGTSPALTSSSGSRPPSASGSLAEPPLQFVDVEPILRSLGPDVVGQVVLVGGQALNFWAERYLKDSPALQREGPFASKDIDFQGGREAVRLCAERLHGEARLAQLDDVTPNIAVVMFVDGNGYERRIDFLESPYGLDPTEARETAIPIEIVNHTERADRLEFLVLHPVLCMEARICNSMGLPKYQRSHGLQQARASVECAHEFLRRELLDIGEVDAVLHLNERIFRFATKHPRGREAAVALGIEPFKAAVLDERLPEKFRTIRFPQMEAHIAQQRETQVRQAVELAPRREREWAERVRTELGATQRPPRQGEQLEARVGEALQQSTTPRELVERAEREAARKHPDLAREVRVSRALVECERSAEPLRGTEQLLQAVGRAVEGPLTPVDPEPRALLLREAEGARREPSVGLPLSSDTDRRIEGERVEQRWRAVVGEELAVIRSRATELQARTETALAGVTRRALEHRDVEPVRPNALLRMVRGETEYREAARAWSFVQEQLARRRTQLADRLSTLHEFAREPAVGFRTKGAALAEHRAGLRDPELARAVNDYRTWLQRGGPEHAPAENEVRGPSRRTPDRGYER